MTSYRYNPATNNVEPVAGGDGIAAYGSSGDNVATFGGRSYDLSGDMGVNANNAIFAPGLEGSPSANARDNMRGIGGVMNSAGAMYGLMSNPALAAAGTALKIGLSAYNHFFGDDDPASVVGNLTKADLPGAQKYADAWNQKYGFTPSRDWDPSNQDQSADKNYMSPLRGYHDTYYLGFAEPFGRPHGYDALRAVKYGPQGGDGTGSGAGGGNASGPGSSGSASGSAAAAAAGDPGDAGGAGPGGVGNAGPGGGAAGVGGSAGTGGSDGNAGEGGAAGGAGAAGPGGDAGGTAGGDGNGGGDGDGGGSEWRGGLVGYAPGGAVGFDGIHHPQTRGVGLNGSVTKGLVESHTPGRADAISTKVPAGTYVVPADVVSAVGQGNTLAGSRKLDTLHAQQPRHTGYAQGGMVDVRLSGGEYRIHPDVVAGLGKGSLEEGRKRLDAMVHHVRSRSVHTLKNLPGPKQ